MKKLVHLKLWTFLTWCQKRFNPNLCFKALILALNFELSKLKIWINFLQIWEFFAFWKIENGTLNLKSFVVLFSNNFWIWRFEAFNLIFWDITRALELWAFKTIWAFDVFKLKFRMIFIRSLSFQFLIGICIWNIQLKFRNYLYQSFELLFLNILLHLKIYNWNFDIFASEHCAFSFNFFFSFKAFNSKFDFYCIRVLSFCFWNILCLWSF